MTHGKVAAFWLVVFDRLGFALAACLDSSAQTRPAHILDFDRL